MTSTTRPPDRTSAAVSSRTVLLAEDHRQVRSAISRGLRGRGFDVVEVGDGQAALVAAGKRHPSVAVVDLSIPVIDGFHVVEQLKASFGAALPVLVISGTNQPDSRLRAFDVGADDFVAKPVNLPELIKRVHAFERSRSAFRDLQVAKDRAEHLRMYAAEASTLLAHDLNNGLCIAISNLDYLRNLDLVKGDAADALLSATRSVARMAGLVRNFVDITRLEDAALIAKCAPTDVCDMLMNAVRIHEPEARHRGATLAFECTPILDANIDSSLIERVVHNLLGNSVRYSGAGGLIQLRAHVEHGGECDSEDSLVIEVGNTGSKVPAELEPILFEKYAKGATGSARRGMGLYFCRLACEAHGGTIALAPSSTLPVNFVVRLPLGSR